MRARGATAILALVALLLSACNASHPDGTPSGASPTPTATSTLPTASPTPTPPPIPDARTVPVASLLRAGTSPQAVLYDDLNGVQPDEIVVLSSKPANDPQLPPIPYLDAFAWDPTREQWGKVFDATNFQDPDTGKGPLLNATDVVGQDVPFLQLIDFASDGVPEVVAAVQNFGASAGPLELWILSWGAESFVVEFTRSTQRGGQLSFADTTVTLEDGVYRDGDPGCCPSATETVLIGWDPAKGRIVVLNRTEKETPQG